MSTYLLDINVLIALAWPVHVHHHAARRWFGASKTIAWATCPMTQTGFVRISSNPSIIRDAVRPEAALAMLKEMTQHPAHSFWPDAVSLAAPHYTFPSMLTGHRQITDSYLVSLAMRNKGVLATLDRGLIALDKTGKYVHIISP